MNVIPIRTASTRTVAATTELERTLSEVRRKIYPRAVAGVHARRRWTVMVIAQAVFYGLPWLEWNGRQALLFDLGGRKFYMFGMVLWPQDFIYFGALLAIAALSLVLFTTIAGRLWCGHACPQTVYTEMFLWVERKFEGDRAARIRLDAAPMSARKFARKLGKHGAWLFIAAWTGFTFLGFFLPIRELAAGFVALQPGPWEAFWVLFYSCATYGNAGWMRERVCKHMCPYGRLQRLMCDADTMVVTYDAERGEPRGAHRPDADPRHIGLGDCVDCGICMQVCPTGIDIRDGLQYECIGCTACIDGCNAVMERMGYPSGLIRYDTANGLSQHLTFRRKVRRALRPRTILYATVLLALAATVAFGVVR